MKLKLIEQGRAALIALAQDTKLDPPTLLAVAREINAFRPAWEALDTTRKPIIQKHTYMHEGREAVHQVALGADIDLLLDTDFPLDVGKPIAYAKLKDAACMTPGILADLAMLGLVELPAEE